MGFSIFNTAIPFALYIESSGSLLKTRVRRNHVNAICINRGTGPYVVPNWIFTRQNEITLFVRHRRLNLCDFAIDADKKYNIYSKVGKLLTRLLDTMHISIAMQLLNAIWVPSKAEAKLHFFKLKKIIIIWSFIKQVIFSWNMYFKVQWWFSKPKHNYNQGAYKLHRKTEQKILRSTV